jgi:2,3-bisphosphoglycerate-independent phosphoglycerate mutase
MDIQDLLKGLAIKAESKIILLVIDGLGGLTMDGGTELEVAHLPNLDHLASISICGMLDPILPGITPGSGPAHLSLFGYDPLKYSIGRGVLEALGVDLPLLEGDLAARGNFATIDKDGKVVDRRAGRMSTERNRELCLLLDGMEIDGVKIITKCVKEHRLVVVFRGGDLSEELSDSDPQVIGVPPLDVRPLREEAMASSRLVNEFLNKAREILRDQVPANMVLLRGFSKTPVIPAFTDLYNVRAACIATYPMYRGIAKMIGMEILKSGQEIEDEFETLKGEFAKYDFFYLHIKRTDSMGEDGNFDGRVKTLEEIDRFIPKVMELEPDVLVVTGDHSTPSILRSHSWHPVPLLIRSRYCRVDGVRGFTEMECMRGGLGRLQSINLMSLILAHAMRLKKYGA